MATVEKTIEIGRALQAAIMTVNGRSEYRAGESDDSLARRIGVKTSAVVHIRKKLYGSLRAPASGIAERLDSLEARIARLEAKANG